MKEFFNVETIEAVLAQVADFPIVDTEEILLAECLGRVLAEDIASDVDIPDFNRSTMDGFAVRASSTFGASEANPAYLAVKGQISMGVRPDITIGPGEVARIATGGMLPEGADSVIMVEHTDILDDTTIEAYRSVAPGQNIIEKGEDILKSEPALPCGRRIRPQEAGLIAACGRTMVTVFRRPMVGIISTGDEVVPVNQVPGQGQIRDINSHSLSGQVLEAGGVPVTFGIVKDSRDDLMERCRRALQTTDMVLISGGSSVGARDFTVEVLDALPDTEILVHGISISPGKPTILARSGHKPFWGLPGHAVSAMVVFAVVVRPFLDRLCGLSQTTKKFPVQAVLNRNLASAQGRVDYVRVRLFESDGTVMADPILGKSGLIHTMVKADGLIAIGMNTEGLYQGSVVEVIPL
ncbi:molybdopterin molybdenumtransferase MoeA [Desulfosarcina ovata subsp. sediminis]|uniref:Molybdopterin molybdenumtransferase n=1 Tax=Desulfosarcina ovata subsp. sediminis TaxID=885957 RepID=A0A5K7ZXF9_9BACT|nr:gephyrin-like molybdotransferase Glp [Desulfosarcina ovata]BBO84856.1 molybdopterin molybdenumtransferase MoeA [Desulfosarcina ovata subsp. sediminis]